MTPRKKNIKKINSSTSPNLRSTVPLLILLIIIGVLISRISSNGSASPVQSQNVAPTQPPAPTQQPLIVDTATSGQVFNLHPSFATLKLPIATANKPYKTIVTGWDADVADELTLTINNLPPGLGYTCEWGPRSNRKFIDCTISGVPVSGYTADVFATLKDDKGATVINKYIFQVIQPTPTPANVAYPTAGYVFPTWTPTP